MSTTVYPNMGNTTNAHASAFFSPLPRAVLTLSQDGRLKPRDLQILAALLDYKNRHTTQVDPKQGTLAARFACSLDTIQRSLARLTAAGLITKTRLRNGLGRLGRCVYDLANTLALMPRHAAKLRHGDYGRDSASPEKETHSAIPQKCGLSEVDSLDVAEADKAHAATHSPMLGPVAAALHAEGVAPRVATSLAGKFDEQRCRQALTALQSRRNVRDRAAWLVGCLLNGWQLTAPAPPPLRPQSHLPYTPPGSLNAPPSHLHALPVSEYAALEARARAELITESVGPVLSTLKQGRNRRLVEGRMCRLLNAQA